MKQLSSDTFSYLDFARQLAQWFQTAQRDLPWRHEENARDAYRVLVSEMMLQQTTVAAVVPFYTRFLARFPDVKSLASASLEEVLPLWAGLGYYQRARLLHRCAQTVVEQHDGEFPHELSSVLALPGIGRYTAGAVTSIAFDAPSPIVDANVARVFSRLFLMEGDLKARANQEQLWRRAEELIEACAINNAEQSTEENRLRPSIINPGLMELGALICSPRSPRCQTCPVQKFCGAFATGRQNELPQAAVKPQTVELRDVCAFITRTNMSTEEQQVLLRQRAHDAKIWWRGMWELPRTTIAENETNEDALRRVLRDELGIAQTNITTGHLLRTISHGVTHHHITLECWSAALNDDVEVAGARWFSWQEAQELALPSSMRRLLLWLEKHGTANADADADAANANARQPALPQQPALW